MRFRPHLLAWPALLIGLLPVIGCSSDSASGDGDGTPIDGGEGDLSVEFGVPDAADAGDDADVTEDESSDGGSDTLGSTCLGDSDCNRGELCVGANPGGSVAGYCTFLNCADHAECDFGDTEAAFCCSDFGDFRGCFREDPGTVCGQGSGRQGDDCSAGGQSDCDGTDYFCIDWYQDSFCAQQCNPATGEGCGPDTWCLATGGGNGICAPGGDTATGQSCAADPDSCQAGAVCDGAFVDPVSPYSYCADLCVRNRDCADDQWCRIFPGQAAGTCIPLGEGGPGASCTEDRWTCQQGLYCLNEGTRFARCTRLCEREADCSEGFTCGFFSDNLGACWPVGEGETGDFCGGDPFSCGQAGLCIGGFGPGYNPDAYCTESCLTNPSGCGDDFICQDFGTDGSFCVPDGSSAAGEACASALECARGTTCIYATDQRQGRCQRLCAGPADCLEGEWCSQPPDGGGVCLPSGQLQPEDGCEETPFDCPAGSICAGDPAICFEECTSDAASCPQGSYCAEPSGAGLRRFCRPFGEVAIGDSCDQAYECEPDSLCGFRTDETPGLCTTDCATDDDCPDSFWCLAARTFSSCLPEGVTPPGGGCVDDRFSCQAGALCLFRDTSAAICARDCTGFPNRCVEGDVCRYIGADLNVCLAVGETAAGGSCAGDTGACDAESLCIGAGTDEATCARICSFEPEACEEGTVCHFFDNGLGVCLTPDSEAEPPL